MQRKFKFAPGEFYHVFSRGVEKRKIFLCKEDYERFISLLFISNSTENIHLSDYISRSHSDILKITRLNTLVDIGAYCLMPNHFHLLLKEKNENGISLFMQKLCTAYSMYFNIKYNRSGTLFSRPFRAKHVKKDVYLNYLFAYIHLNPLEILNKNSKDISVRNINKSKKLLDTYKYSSYLDYMNAKRSVGIIINKTAFPKYFETSMNNFKNFIKEWIVIREDNNLKEFSTVKVTP